MSVAEFISNRFVGETLCLFLGNDAETITYNQTWMANREYFRGTIVEVSDGVVVLEIPKCGILYINSSEIKAFWQDPFDYHKAVSASLSKRAAGAQYKDI